MITGGGFSVNSGFTKILCTPEKPLYIYITYVKVKNTFQFD